MKFNKIKPHRLLPDEIKQYIDKFQREELPKLIDKESYFNGQNPYILNRAKEVSSDAPDWRVRVSYARKIINTVAGYLFKPGNIRYNYKNETYRKDIDDIFTRNKETILSSQLGKIVSTQGFGYELFLADKDANPIWVVGDVKEIIPFYNDSLTEDLLAFIRFVKVDEPGDKHVVYADVYYPDIIEHWKYEESTVDGQKALVEKSTTDTVNIYAASGKPPLVVYKNNEEMIGDFETLIECDGRGGLIDGYDVMLSDGMNEEDRFAWAYLLMSENLTTKDLAEIKKKRAFTLLGEKGYVKFLTKDIPTAFFELMKKWLHDEIHNQSHVPDFLDMSGGPLTGAALDRLLYDFEFVCATKETFFKDGLLDRIKMLDAIKNITDTEFVSQDVEIVMNRNRPADNLANAQIVSTYKSSGMPITDKTLMENFATFVKNVDEEIAAYDEQQQASMELFAEQQSMFKITDTSNSTSTEEKST